MFIASQDQPSPSLNTGTASLLKGPFFIPCHSSPVPVSRLQEPDGFTCFRFKSWKMLSTNALAFRSDVGITLLRIRAEDEYQAADWRLIKCEPKVRVWCCSKNATVSTFWRYIASHSVQTRMQLGRNVTHSIVRVPQDLCSPLIHCFNSKYGIWIARHYAKSYRMLLKLWIGGNLEIRRKVLKRAGSYINNKSYIIIQHSTMWRKVITMRWARTSLENWNRTKISEVRIMGLSFAKQLMGSVLKIDQSFFSHTSNWDADYGKWRI